MNRRNQMIWLAVLTALTLIGQYVMLGNTGIGQSKVNLPWWFWILEQSLWGLRALVEVGVVIYIGMTTAQNEKQERILWYFKAGLIGLIVITVGPVWAAYSLGDTIIEILSRGGVILWGFTLAGISATMLAGVSYAYKTQPFDYDIDAELQEANDRVIELEYEMRQKSNIIHELTIEKQGFDSAVQFLRLLPPTAVVQLLARFSETQLDATEVAESTGLAVSTVRSVLSRARNGE